MPRSILSFDLLETLMIKTGIFPLQSPSAKVVGETATSLLCGGIGEMGNHHSRPRHPTQIDFVRPCHEVWSEIAADTMSLSTVGNVPYLGAFASGQLSFLCQTLIFLGITSFNTSSILFHPRISWGAAKLAQQGNNCVHRNVGDQWKPWWENGVIFALAHLFGVVWEQKEIFIPSWVWLCVNALYRRFESHQPELMSL